MSIEITPKNKKTIVIAYVIGILLDLYKEDEKTKAHKEIRRRITIEMGKLVTKYGKEPMREILEKHGFKVWKDTLNEFADNNIQMNARTCILFLYGMDDKNLFKLFTLGKGKVEKWGKYKEDKAFGELDNDSRDIAKYIVSSVNGLYGIKEEKNASLSVISKRVEEAKKKKESLRASA